MKHYNFALCFAFTHLGWQYCWWQRLDKASELCTLRIHLAQKFVSAECQTVDPFAKVKPNSIPSKSIKRESDRGSRDRYSRKTIGMLLSRVGRAQKGQITAEAELGKRYEELQGIRRIKRIWRITSMSEKESQKMCTPPDKYDWQTSKNWYGSWDTQFFCLILL